jgi:hypothetical protein
MKISVCCPSYKRPKVESLDYLSFVKVYVDNKEYEDYIKANPGFEKNIISVPDGIQGNVSRIRNYILDQEFKDGADVVCIIDDDLKGIYHFELENGYAYKDKLVKEEEFLDFIEKGTILCKDIGFKLWGVNLNKDALNYKHCLPFNTKAVILGPFSCHLSDSEIRYDENLPLKEDYDLAIQHLNKYRGILRLNKYHYNCKQSINPGGCATYRNREREEQQFKLLQKKWGSKVVKQDKTNKGDKEKIYADYNPIIHIPIKGV